MLSLLHLFLSGFQLPILFLPASSLLKNGRNGTRTQYTRTCQAFRSRRSGTCIPGHSTRHTREENRSVYRPSGRLWCTTSKVAGMWSLLYFGRVLSSLAFSCLVDGCFASRSYCGRAIRCGIVFCPNVDIPTWWQKNSCRGYLLTLNLLSIDNPNPNPNPKPLP